MFSAKVKSEILKETVNVISTLINEAKFKVSKDGIRVMAVDGSHIAMIDLELGASAFEEFKADEMDLGIDLEKLKTVLKNAKSDEIIEVMYNPDRNILEFELDAIEMTMALLDSSNMSEPKVPDLEHKVRITVAKNLIDRGLKAASDVGTYVEFKVTPEEVVIHTEGESDTMNMHLPKDKLDELVCEEETSSKYSLEYIGSIIKTVNAEALSIQLSTDYPIKLFFDIAKGEGKVTYMLAPRVDNY
jgi:proliferating cell nuclear antigen